MGHLRENPKPKALVIAEGFRDRLGIETISSAIHFISHRRNDNNIAPNPVLDTKVTSVMLYGS